MPGGVRGERVPSVAAPRLVRYLRLLKRVRQQGIERISSQEIAQHLGTNAAQVRKDLSYFGCFGVRGVGYDVESLISELSACLGIDREWTMIIVGAGRMGSALARYKGFGAEGFRCVAIFDADPGVVGKRIGDLVVKPAEEMGAFIRENKTDIAVIAVPAEAAQQVASTLINAGVKGILNFAPVRLSAVPGVVVHNLDLTNELILLTFYISREVL